MYKYVNLTGKACLSTNHAFSIGLAFFVFLLIHSMFFVLKSMTSKKKYVIGVFLQFLIKYLSNEYQKTYLFVVIHVRRFCSMSLYLVSILVSHAVKVFNLPNNM